MKNISSKNDKKNILITGANGFIGKHLSRHLDGKHCVFKLDLGITSGTKNAISLDLSDTESVRPVVTEFAKNNRVDAIVHLASKFATSSNNNDINILYSNLKMTESVVEMVRLLKPAKLIVFSSIAVYPNKSGTYDEESEIRPSMNAECLYGLSKFCAENIFDFMLKDEKVIISHIRLAQVYGEGMRNDRIIPIFIREIKENNSITLYGEGKRISNFIGIDKVLETVDHFLKRDLQGIYNIGGEHMSYMELAKRIIREHGDDHSTIMKKKQGAISMFHMDTSKAEKAIGLSCCAKKK